MTPQQVKRSVSDFKDMARDIRRVADGFGLEGVTISIVAGTATWSLSEILFDDEALMLLGVGQNSDNGRWFRVYLDPKIVTYIEFEQFPTSSKQA